MGNFYNGKLDNLVYITFRSTILPDIPNHGLRQVPFSLSVGRSNDHNIRSWNAVLNCRNYDEAERTHFLMRKGVLTMNKLLGKNLLSVARSLFCMIRPMVTRSPILRYDMDIVSDGIRLPGRETGPKEVNDEVGKRDVCRVGRRIGWIELADSSHRYLHSCAASATKKCLCLHS
jgi:hypothetical protein